VTEETSPNLPSDPTVSGGRLMIDILSWDWKLQISVSLASKRSKPPFQGLDYGRDFTLLGQVRGPRELRGKGIKVTLSPFGPKVRFGQGGLRHLGELVKPLAGSDFDLEARLILPEDAIATTATALASVWKHIQLQTDHGDISGTRILSYAFHASIHPNLEPWANGD
jgi:hypothetical protein